MIFLYLDVDAKTSNADDSSLILFLRAGASGNSSSLASGSDLSSVLMQQSYPDMSYCRVPRDIKCMVESGRPTIVFEAGSVLRCVGQTGAEMRQV